MLETEGNALEKGNLLLDLNDFPAHEMSPWNVVCWKISGRPCTTAFGLPHLDRLQSCNPVNVCPGMVKKACEQDG